MKSDRATIVCIPDTTEQRAATALNDIGMAIKLACSNCDSAMYVPSVALMNAIAGQSRIDFLCEKCTTVRKLADPEAPVRTARSRRRAA